MAYRRFNSRTAGRTATDVALDERNNYDEGDGSTKGNDTHSATDISHDMI
jgi:hypothetical protein